MAPLFVLIFAALGGMGVIAWYVTRNKKKALGRAAASALCGIGALAAVNLFSAYTGVSIALNFVTAFFSVVYSLPGVVLLLLSRILFAL
ncbi:MAG: pro-sigmaK processing inhibitor BofA family protein [Oscillospiraceae bacterium]|nr:pro-sigmaK processing inhibitor BofA family protein [Oscillospiraceae bacterium]